MELVYLFSILATLFAATTSKAIPLVTPAHLPRNTLENGLTPYSTSRYHLNHRAVDVHTEWSKALCKGIRLTQAMIVTEEKALEFVTPVRSQWTGDLVEEFKTWGYREMPGARDLRCDFGPETHDLERAFKAMGIDTRSSSEGGPNVCYHIEHLYGPAVIKKPDGRWPKPEEQTYKVNRKEYRVSSRLEPIRHNVLTSLHRSRKPTLPLVSTPTLASCTLSTASARMKPQKTNGTSQSPSEKIYLRFARPRITHGVSGTARIRTAWATSRRL
jgi:hypothetical protein